MAKNKHFTVKYRRKRQKKTDYRLRKLLLSSNKPRLVVRKSLKNILAQIITYHEKGDKVIATATTGELKKFGWDYHNNIPSAYLLGLLIGKKAKKHNISQAVLDIGVFPSTKGSKLYAVLKGALDAGLEIPHADNILPSHERITGRHILEFHQHPIQEKLKKHPSKTDPGEAHGELQRKFQEVQSKIS